MAFKSIDGFEIGDQLSDGEVSCIDCWDEGGNDIEKNCCIRKGCPVYWRLVNTEYGEYSAYCSRHAQSRSVEVY